MSQSLDGAEAVGALLAVIAIFAAGIAFTGWLIMLAFGVLHGTWASVPAISYPVGLTFVLPYALLTGSSSISGSVKRK